MAVVCAAPTRLSESSLRRVTAHFPHLQPVGLHSTRGDPASCVLETILAVNSSRTRAKSRHRLSKTSWSAGHQQPGMRGQPWQPSPPGTWSTLPVALELATVVVPHLPRCPPCCPPSSSATIPCPSLGLSAGTPASPLPASCCSPGPSLLGRPSAHSVHACGGSAPEARFCLTWVTAGSSVPNSTARGVDA